MTTVYLYKKRGGSPYPSVKDDLVHYLEHLLDGADSVLVSIRGEDVWVPGGAFLEHGDEAFTLVAGEPPPPDYSRILITTEAAPSFSIDERLGVVSGQCAHGMNIVKDLFSDVRNIVGGRSKTIERGLKDGLASAIAELQREAGALGANAVVGVQFSQPCLTSAAGHIVVVTAIGTAVKSKDLEPK